MEDRGNLNETRELPPAFSKIYRFILPDIRVCKWRLDIRLFYFLAARTRAQPQYTVNPPVLNFRAGFFILEGDDFYGLGMKKCTKRRKYWPEYRRYAPPPAPPEPEVCTRSEKCADCPYPASGFICWSGDGDCMRTRMEKLQGKEENK